MLTSLWNLALHFSIEFPYALHTFVAGFFLNQKTLNSPTRLKASEALLNAYFWNKARVLYYLNNWVYTTNHKKVNTNNKNKSRFLKLSIFLMHSYMK